LHTILAVFDRNSIQWEQMPTIERTFTKKRVGPRFSFLVDAEIVLGDGTSIPTQLDEVSLRGCYLDTLEPIPVGTRFLLKIGQGRKAFEVQGKVIYTHSGSGLGIFGQGVVFTDLSAKERSAINLWLRELTSKRIARSIREI
jgi:PilZ domain-containing protein